MSNPAEDEFNALIARNTTRTSHHPEDRSSASDEDDEPTTVRAGRSLRSGSRRIPQDLQDSDDSFASDSPPRPSAFAGTPDNSAFHLPRSSRVSPGHTGPKGVITDAWAAERERRDKSGRSKTLRTDAAAASRGVAAGSWTQQQRASGRNGRHGHFGDDESEDGLDEADEEDEYVKRWRDTRIREFKAQQGAEQLARRGRYGTVQPVDAMGYLEAVDSTPPPTVVVVYIYDDELPISKAYQQHLNAIASKHSHVRFVALHYDDAEMEHAGVPAIVAYRNGEKIADLVPLVDEVPFTCNVVTNLEEALKSKSIL